MAEKKVKKLEKKVAKLEAVKAKLMDAFKHSNEAVSNAAKVSAISRDHSKTVPLRFASTPPSLTPQLTTIHTHNHTSAPT